MNTLTISSLIFSGSLALMSAEVEPLPISKSFWQDESFVKSFNGSYRIEARIEPTVSTEERGLLVEVQKLMAGGSRKAALAKVRSSDLLEKSAALQFNLGNLYFEEGELEEAAAAYGQALERYPSFRRAHRNLGLVHVRQDEIEAALESLLEALRLGDSDGTTYGMLGFCRMQQGEYATALQAYRMASLSQPRSAEWKAGVAQCLQHLEAREEAVALVDEVIRLRPREASYAMLQASLLMELGQPDGAVKALELPRRLGTLDGDGLMLLGELHLRAERLELARTMVGEAFAAESQPTLDRSLGWIALALRQEAWDLARQVITAATPEEGEVPVALESHRGRLLIESGENPAAGVECLEDVLQRDPGHGPALLSLAGQRVVEDDLALAEILYERATTDPAVALEAWIELTKLQVAGERFADALESVDQALGLQSDPSLLEYRKALERLADAAR
jgi:tetratricopeptide (TPR) repeat protein